MITKGERGGGLGRRGVCGDLRAGDKAVRVSVGAGGMRVQRLMPTQAPSLS